MVGEIYMTTGLMMIVLIYIHQAGAARPIIHYNLPLVSFLLCFVAYVATELFYYH